MSWGQWMIVEFSVEEELRIESQARTVLHCEDSAEVARLCSSLVKQNAYLSQLVRQATGHIAELEMTMVLEDLNATDPETEEVIRLLCESGNSDLIHPSDIQVQSPIAKVLLTVVGTALDLAEWCHDRLSQSLLAIRRADRG